MAGRVLVAEPSADFCHRHVVRWVKYKPHPLRLAEDLLRYLVARNESLKPFLATKVIDVEQQGDIAYDVFKENGVEVVLQRLLVQRQGDHRRLDIRRAVEELLQSWDAECDVLRTDAGGMEGVEPV